MFFLLFYILLSFLLCFQLWENRFVTPPPQEGAHRASFQKGAVTQPTDMSASHQEGEEEKSYGKSRRAGWGKALVVGSMSDAEAQSAPPSAPVEDKPQVERKVIGGLPKVTSNEHSSVVYCFIGILWNEGFFFRKCVSTKPLVWKRVVFREQINNLNSDFFFSHWFDAWWNYFLFLINTCHKMKLHFR